MSGIHAYARIRTLDAYQDVPVLFYTASPERVRSARLTGNFAVATKPMDIDSLLTVIAQLLQRDPGLLN
jgi:CheY-like chemotaxis protein